MIETQFGVSIKAIRSDNGGEFIGKPFTNIMKVHSIVPELTACNLSHQNGVPEQKICTLVTGAICLLQQSGLLGGDIPLEPLEDLLYVC